MKNSLLLSIVAGAAAGAASALATSLALVDPAPRTAESVAVVPAESAASVSEPWSRDLERLRADHQMLSDRLQSIEQRPAAEVSREPVEATLDPAAAQVEDQLRQLVAAMTNADAPLPEALATSVREVYTAMQEEERLEREARFAEARDAEMTARMERFAAELELDEYQTSEMRAILTRERDTREELVGEARDAGTFLELRDQMLVLRNTTRTELEHVLTADQLKKYDSLDRSRFVFGTGPGGASRAFGGGFGPTGMPPAPGDERN